MVLASPSGRRMAPRPRSFSKKSDSQLAHSSTNRSNGITTSRLAKGAVSRSPVVRGFKFWGDRRREKQRPASLDSRTTFNRAASLPRARSVRETDPSQGCYLQFKHARYERPKARRQIGPLPFVVRVLEQDCIDSFNHIALASGRAVCNSAYFGE
jgi:hypothetical protein